MLTLAEHFQCHFNYATLTMSHCLAITTTNKQLENMLLKRETTVKNHHVSSNKNTLSDSLNYQVV